MSHYKSQEINNTREKFIDMYESIIINKEPVSFDEDEEYNIEQMQKNILIMMKNIYVLYKMNHITTCKYEKMIRKFNNISVNLDDLTSRVEKLELSRNNIPLHNEQKQSWFSFIMELFFVILCVMWLTQNIDLKEFV